ncbi:prepilin-type N-terminal cleavage/methylation domain-containing protein [Aeromicrobium sp.]|nr:prepilin-type N-terminal cleavage/methylation domain-containing protein [Candidatus Saccharibacteria bacterium]
MISLKKQNKGFTIVELLIVIVVIGILAGLVITTYNGIQQKARNTERTTDLKTFQSQLEAYNANNGRYPTSTDLGTNSGTNVTWTAANLKGMDKETLRDPKGSDFSLATASTANKYAYAPTPLGCDNATTDCAAYKLTAKQEGSTTDITVDSLN